jgi:hypothetical protein
MVCSLPFLLLFIRVLYSCLLIKVVGVGKVKSDAWFRSPVTPFTPLYAAVVFGSLKVSFAQARSKISLSFFCVSGCHAQVQGASQRDNISLDLREAGIADGTLCFKS